MGTIGMFNLNINSNIQRNTLRKIIRSRRQQLSIAEQQEFALQLSHILCQHPKIISATTIAVYFANDSEIDLSPFVDWCFSQNKKLYLPVLHPFSPGHLLFLAYQDDTVFINNKYGIPEPKLDVGKVLPLNQLDVLLTPLVAFDAMGNRLGMGGGFFDRTLSHWYMKNGEDINHNLRPYPIGVAHNCQQVDNIPIEHWDIPLPEIITPNQSHLWPQTN